MITPFDIAVFLLVLGVLIFVHELGHFLAAKACGIYVDRFSLGMPPRVFGFKIGETDYCVGLLPIGGFVRMAGQEDAPLSEEEREQTYGHVPPDRWYSNKPIWQRAIVLFAGPFMNFVLAFFIYAALAAVGREVPLSSIDTRVGMVEDNSPAAEAPLYAVGPEGMADFSQTPDDVGWETGDRIVSINGKAMNRFQDIFFEAVLGNGRTARVEIVRESLDGETTRFISPIEPKILDDEIQASRFGFAPYSAALIDHVIPDSPAAAHGLEPGDVILTANGRRVDSGTFSKMVSELEPGSRLELRVLRNDEVIDLVLETRTEGRFQEIGFTPSLRPFLLLGESDKPAVVAENADLLTRTGLRPGDRILSVNGEENVGAALRGLYESGSDEAFEVSVERPVRLGTPQAVSATISLDDALWLLTGTDPGSPVEIAGITAGMAEETGLQRRDVIVVADGEPATARRLRQLEQDRAGEAIAVTVKRPALLFGLAQDAAEIETELPVAEVQQIGVVWGTESAFVRSKPADILPAAWNECVTVTQQTYATLHRLVTGALSPKLLGGPVMIAEVTTKAARVGLVPLFEMMALISINLAIFNLLPLPVLDGGQLAFLGIEAVRRKPVSMKVMEAVQQVGILLILGLIVFVTFNDISRVVGQWMP